MLEKEQLNIILIGGGGHCKACIDVIEQEAKFSILGILDDNESKIGTSIMGYTILGTTLDLELFLGKCSNYLITVGQIKSPENRVRIFKQLKKHTVHLPVIISPWAYVSKHAKIEEGTIIMHHALVNAYAIIKENCIINTKAVIEHDSTIGAHCHISTGSIINGTVDVGQKTFIGSLSTLVNNISIADESIVASGSVVVKSISKKGIYAGNPALKIY